MSTKFTVTISGLDDVKKKFEQINATDVDKITETYARKMASDAADYAPVKTGALKNSLASSPKKSDEKGVWQWGSDLPYATRQEYEHKSKKAFVRKAIWNNEKEYKDAIRRQLMKG